MKRLIQRPLLDDLKKKIVLLTGPRQCGKTTVSKQLFSAYDYFSYDLVQDRLKLQALAWKRDVPLLIFDELHKMKHWKQWLKGVYDTQGIPPAIMVTGSARLDVAKKMGDSLAGRFFQHRLHPLDLKELYKLGLEEEATLDRLFTCSGFPEPFLTNSSRFYKKWQKSHLDIIVRQDLLAFQSVRDIVSIETLIELLRHQVGSTVSYASLARTLGVDPTSVKRWLVLLENLYVVFKVTPFANTISRSIRKEPKYYFYDTALVEGHEGIKLENVVACALLKELQVFQDQAGARNSLHFLRTKEGKEIDFLVVQEKKGTHLIEVKWAEDRPSSSFGPFKKYFPDAIPIQLVQQLDRSYSTPTGIRIEKAEEWLKRLNLEIV